MARTTPFHRSLIETRLTMGMDRSLLGLLAIVSMGLTIASKSLWPLVAATAVGLVLRNLFATDPLYLLAYGNYCSEGDMYEPWPARSGPRSGRRPGRGRGVLC